MMSETMKMVAVVLALGIPAALITWSLTNFIVGLRQLSHAAMERYRANVIRADTLWQSLRAELLAGGRGKHNAYHVVGDGTVLAVDVADLYLAIFAGVYDFWDLVADPRRDGRSPFAISLEEIDFSNGEGHFTHIHDGSGDTFIDGDIGGGAAVFANADMCARVTADDFKYAVIHRKAEAAKCDHGGDVKIFHATDSTKSV